MFSGAAPVQAGVAVTFIFLSPAIPRAGEAEAAARTVSSQSGFAQRPRNGFSWLAVVDRRFGIMDVAADAFVFGGGIIEIGRDILAGNKEKEKISEYAHCCRLSQQSHRSPTEPRGRKNGFGKFLLQRGQ